MFTVGMRNLDFGSLQIRYLHRSFQKFDEVASKLFIILPFLYPTGYNKVKLREWRRTTAQLMISRDTVWK